MGSICSCLTRKKREDEEESEAAPDDGSGASRGGGGKTKPVVPPKQTAPHYEYTGPGEGEGRDNEALQMDETPVTKKIQPEKIHRTLMDTLNGRYTMDPDSPVDTTRVSVRYTMDPTVALKHRTLLSPHEIEGFIKEGRKLARGVYDYPGCVDDDATMEVGKGDILEILKQDNDWWKAKNLETGEEGYVPSTFVALENSLELCPWFHGSVSRADAIILLRASGNEPGTFLVRESETKIGSYVLSILCTNRLVKHYRIRNLNLGGCFIFETSKFESLPAMIEKYETDPEDRLCERLSHPCPKPKPQMWDLSRKTRDQWEIARDELELVRQLGSGNFGEVWQGLWKGRTDVAIKTLKEGSMEPEKFLEEAAIMKRLKHPKLIRLFAVCTQEQPIFIVTELMPNGSLKNYLNKNSDIQMSQIIYIATQVADGMCYIEKSQLIHRDLAARNILMGDECQVKICDFGLARIINEDVYVAKQGAKCPMKWTAPEAVFYQQYTIKSDVWAFGILLVELTNGGITPYPGLSNRDVVERLGVGYRHSQPANCPNELYDIMRSCWYKDPSDRPTFEILYKDLEEYPVD